MTNTKVKKNKSAQCPYPGCLFCLIKDTNTISRRSNIAKFLKELPAHNDDGQVLAVSALWNIAMVRPTDKEFVELGVLECMSALIRKGIQDQQWLWIDQNIYIPYYAAHIIGSYTMLEEIFSQRAVEDGVIEPLLGLLKGDLTWVEQRVALRALGHLATYSSTFPQVSKHATEIIPVAKELSQNAPSIVYSQLLSGKTPKAELEYQRDLLTRGIGGAEMELKKAEEWASQLQCWSLQLINCFTSRNEFLPVICEEKFVGKLIKIWGGLVNENSPAGIGLLRTICGSDLGRNVVSGCQDVVEGLCNVARSCDDWQYMAIECLLALLQDQFTRFKVLDRVVITLTDLAELSTALSSKERKIGEMIINTLLQDFDGSSINSSNVSANSIMSLSELLSSKRRLKTEQSVPKEDLQIRQAAALVVRLEGNAKFSCGDVEAAFVKYTEALALCPIKARKERVLLYSNRAQCQLMLHNYEAAVSDATRALCIHHPVNRHNSSLWRRAQAYELLDLAKESLLDAIMYMNECTYSFGSDKRMSRVPRYIEGLVKRQIQATWLFREAEKRIVDSSGEGSHDGNDSGWETTSDTEVIGNENYKTETRTYYERRHHPRRNWQQTGSFILEDLLEK